MIYWEVHIWRQVVAPLGISIDGFPSSEYPTPIMQKTFKIKLYPALMTVPGMNE